MLLAIDTSTDTASLALVQDHAVLAELTWHCGQNHTTQLLPHLNHLLEQAKINLPSISGIIVARGPGSFNGLRVGISTAKGLALSLGCPIIGISTLEAAAYAHAAAGLPVCPVFNAGRGEVATAIFQQKGQKWCQLTAEHITTVDTLCSQITTRTVFCGDFVSSIADRLKDTLKRKAIILSPAARLRRAGFLAELGLRRFENGDFDNSATLQPIYLRRPAITKPKNKTTPQFTATAVKTVASTGGHKETRTVIWDMDGVIAETAPFHFRSWQSVFEKRAISFTEDDFKRNFGRRNDAIIINALGQDTPQSEIEAIATEKEDSFRNLIRHNIKPLPGAIDLIKSLREHKFKMALASSAPMENIRLILNSLGIKDCFQVIITGQDVAEGKPSPQGFLLAARKLGVKPESCVVIEDAVAGIAAAKRAGMFCLAITNTHSRTKLAEADIVVNTLEKVSVIDLERLLSPS